MSRYLVHQRDAGLMRNKTDSWEHRHIFLEAWSQDSENLAPYQTVAPWWWSWKRRVHGLEPMFHLYKPSCIQRSKLSPRKMKSPKFTKPANFVTWTSEDSQTILLYDWLFEAYQLSYATCPIPSPYFKWKLPMGTELKYTHKNWCKCHLSISLGRLICF